MKDQGDKKMELISYPPDSNGRDQSWYESWLRYGLNMWQQNRCLVSSAGILWNGANIQENRLYAIGRQSLLKYAPMPDPVDAQSQPTTPTPQGSWDNHMLMPKMLTLAREKVLEYPLDVVTDGIGSSYNRKRKKAVGLMKAKMSPLGALGPAQELPAGVAEPEDADDMLNMGLVRMREESVLKDLLDTSLSKSEQDAPLRCLDDLFELGIAAQEVVLSNDGTPYRRRLAPEQLIYPYSDSREHRDGWFAGVIETVPISKLRTISGLSEEELVRAARKDNEAVRIPDNILSAADASARVYYESLTCRVLRMYWVASDAESYMVGIYPKNGTLVFKRKPENFKESEHVSLETKCCNYVYQGSLVVSSGKTFGCRRMDGQVRLDGTVELPIKIYTMNKPSLVTRARRLVDDIQVEMNSIASTLAKLPPFPRQTIDESLLKVATDVSGRGNQLTKNIREFYKTGTLRLRSKNEFGNPESASNRAPIMPIDMDIERELVMRMNRIEVLKNELRDVTGLNEAVDGGLKNPSDMLVGVMNSMSMSASKSLAEFLQARVSLEGRVVQHIGNYLKMAVRYFEWDIPSDVRESILSGVFDIGVKIGATKQQVEFFLQQLMNNKNLNLLNEGDFMVIFNMVVDGDLKKAQYYMVKAVRKSKAEAAALQQQSIAMQNDGLMKMSAQNNEAAAAMKKMQASIEESLEKLKSSLRMSEGQRKDDEEFKRLMYEIKSKIMGDSVA